MATVEEVVKDIQSIAPIDVSPMALAKWIDNRYKEIVSRVRFKHLRKTGELVLPALIDDGSVTITRGSTSLTGDGSTWETDIGSGDQTHYYFRGSNAWYKIASVDGEEAITLASAFAEDSISGASYKIVKRTHALASDARWLGAFVIPRLAYRLNFVTREEFDISYPGRRISGVPLMVACEDGVDSNGYTQIEIYPPPSQTELVRYAYWSLPTSLTMGSTIPQVIDAYVIKEGAMIDVYRKAKFVEVEKGNVDAAGLYSNSEAKQRTIFDKYIKDAIRTQQGNDDLSFILQGYGGVRYNPSEIRTARDHILANWSVP
jgi:hypothetical protein